MQTKSTVLQATAGVRHALDLLQVLLFSRSVKMLNILEKVVMRRGMLYLRLDGQTPREDRQQMVDDFNNNPAVFLFLISTGAGGTGLNLASANKCAATYLPCISTLITCGHREEAC